MNPRFSAILEAAKHIEVPRPVSNPAEVFGSLVFTKTVMEQMLPKDVFQNLSEAMDGLTQIKPEYIDVIAIAMKDWATSKGATHYTHWFHPLNGTTAEKHDAFIEPGPNGQAIDRFSGKQLLVGEPDASSFPSGGLRSTFESRGYTGWDPTSPVFISKRNDGNTLCIPSIFYSWTGDVLDAKIPLLRSDKKMNDVCLRLLSMTGIPAKQVFSTLGCEQEYFIINKLLYSLRPDLMMTGRTLFGLNSAKGQELQDHYLGSVRDKVFDYMRDFEEAAFEIGIPLKTRHNEVAPAQHEAAPTFERASVAVDHNILLMELMRKTAVQHGLECLLHEKPFAAINGSGKHCNWSLSTDQGLNLLDPAGAVDNDLHFLILLTAVLQAIHRHASLLRASIATASNDQRLGGHEAPPPIISVYLGGDLENLLDIIESGKTHQIIKTKGSHDLGIHVIPPIPKDTTDRNRTSPFAFTGNKFEFRAVGSSQSPAMPITVLNAITAESLSEILDQIDAGRKKGESLLDATLQVIRKSLTKSKPIRYFGDNYTHEWTEEAKRRKLPNLSKSVDSFEYFKTTATCKAFEGILNKEELKSRYEVALEVYCEKVLIELRCALDIAQTQIVPIAIKEQSTRAKALTNLQKILSSIPSEQIAELKKLSTFIELCIAESNELAGYIDEVKKLPWIERAENLSSKGSRRLENLRSHVDAIEKFVDDELWILPKYRELLFVI